MNRGAFPLVTCLLLFSCAGAIPSSSEAESQSESLISSEPDESYITDDPILAIPGQIEAFGLVFISDGLVASSELDSIIGYIVLDEEGIEDDGLFYYVFDFNVSMVDLEKLPIYSLVGFSYLERFAVVPSGPPCFLFIEESIYNGMDI